MQPRRLLVVEDSFRIPPRGVVLAPPLADGLVRTSAAVSLELRLPSGETARVTGRVLQEHLRLVGGGSRNAWIVVLDDSAAKPPPGTEVFLETCEPAHALGPSEHREP